MEQFSLDKWLQDKSRKVVTRDGRNVRIICTDAPNQIPYIYGFMETSTGIDSWRKDGMWATKESCNDLFFADEEEGLNEFEKVVQNILNEPHYQDIQAVKQWSKTLLDLARKELEANYYTKILDYRMMLKSELHAQDLQTAYDMGKQDALRDLPK